jgi:hypothetical protein
MLYEVKVEKGDESDIFAVGFWETDGSSFTALADFETEMLAYAFINYLNGGSGEVFAQFKK